jgi:hypothetical protein
MSEPELAPYHRWTPRQRWWFEVFIQLLCVLVVAGGVWECTGPPPDPCPRTVTP